MLCCEDLLGGGKRISSWPSLAVPQLSHPAPAKPTSVAGMCLPLWFLGPEVFLDLLQSNSQRVTLQQFLNWNYCQGLVEEETHGAPISQDALCPVCHGENALCLT